MGALESREGSAWEDSLVPLFQYTFFPGGRTKKCRPLSRRRCPLPPAPLTAHSIREQKWVMPSPGGIIRVPEANFLLHDLGLEQIWKQDQEGWSTASEHQQTGRGSSVGKMHAVKPPLESCGRQPNGKEPSKEQMPPSGLSQHLARADRAGRSTPLGLLFLPAEWHQSRTCLQGIAGLETIRDEDVMPRTGSLEGRDLKGQMQLHCPPPRGTGSTPCHRGRHCVLFRCLPFSRWGQCPCCTF